MTASNKVIAIVETHKQAENAIKTLAESGFELDKLSIIGKGYQSEEHATGFYNTGDRVKNWGKTGALWGGVWGTLLGSGLFWIPTVGSLLIAGPFVTIIVTALESAAVTGGLTALGGALASIGIKKDSIIKYEMAIKTEKYLIIMDLNDEQLINAKKILKDHEINIH
ncbi:MAG: general stress protein [Psychromonas sp.]